MHKSAFSPRILAVYLLLIGALLLAIASLHHQQQQQNQLFEAMIFIEKSTVENEYVILFNYSKNTSVPSEK